jgi:predicted phosphodiesterase
MGLSRGATVGLALVAGACSTNNQSGDFAATRTGDLSHPLAERGAPDELESRLCGPGAVRGEGPPHLRRAPYLQQVSDRGARVLWTADEGPADAVRLWQPEDGAQSLARSATAAIVDGADPAAGVLQSAGAVDELQPDTIYCYTLGTETRAATEAAGFRTAPEAGSGAKVSFVAFGDSGDGGADQQAVLEQLQTVPFRFMIHTGDIAYDTGTMQQFEDNYFAVYAPLLDSFAMFPSIGNHDDAGVYRRVYDLPWQGFPNWYSFDQGDVHFVALDTTQMSQAQAEWLDRDLAANQREWVIVYGHHPPYSSGEHGSSLEFRELFNPILEAHQVDLVLSGHDHHYERMEPQNGVNYVVTGGGGRGTRPVRGADFTAFAESVLHFVYVEIEADQLLLHAIDATGVEFDQLVISR